MQRFRSILVLLLSLPLVGCFDEPIREHFHVTVRGAGPVVVTVVQEVADPDRAHQNPQLADRMEESRATIEDDLDPWSRRFALLQPLAEHQSVERIAGKLRRSVHSAVLPSFDDVVRMMEADGLTGGLSVSGGVAELGLFPTGGSRATFVQRQEVRRLLTEWSATLAVYFESVIDLYDHLGRRPDRAVPCFAHIFDKHEEVPESGPLDPNEEELVKRVKASVDDVVLALLVADDSEYSLNELTRLVYDPFPARLTFAVQGRVLQTEGLVPEAGFFERPAVDAWNALRSLDGRWMAPDLVTTLASPAPEDQQPDSDPIAFASLPRYSAEPPTPAEVESALLGELVPEDVLTLRWRTPPDAESEPAEGSDSWLSIMKTAEAVVLD